MNAYTSHQPLLKRCLSITKGTVIELGCGEGSTPLLRELCEQSGREFISYESNKDYADKYNSILARSWDDVKPAACGLLFVDHAPGERRKIDIARFKQYADVIVVHDTEASADYGYKMSGILSQFKYRYDHIQEGLPQTTAVSDFININSLNIHIISNGGS